MVGPVVLRSLTGLVLAALTAVPAWAQDVSARAYLTPANGVQVDRPFTLNLEITGVQRFDAQPQIPSLDPFATYLGAGTSTNRQMINGQTTVSLTVQFRFQAAQEGTFEVPAMSVRAGGQTLTTEPLQLLVTTGPPPAAAGTAEAGDASGVSSTDLFITATPSKTSVLDGEPLVVEYRIWTRVNVNAYTITSLPEPEGFWVEELDSGELNQTEQRERNGEPYVTALVRRVALVPSGAGQRTIDPLAVEAQVRVRRQSNDPFDRLFPGSLLAQREPVAVLSNPVTITVRPLPSGRPEPFSGVVGALALEATLDRDTVAANDAVTLTIQVSGTGNLRSVPDPVGPLPDDFEVFPPEVTTRTRRAGAGLAGTRTYEYVMIPRAPGNRTIPAITLGYYDTEAGGYRTASTGDIGLVVTGTGTEGLTARGGRGGVTELRRDIRFIRMGDGDLRAADRGLLWGPAFWMFLLLPLVTVAGALGLSRHQGRLELDVAYARGRRAGRVAKKRLTEARSLAVGDDTRAFYAEVARALRGLVADRLNLAEAGLQTAELSAVLGSRGVRDETAAELIECLEYCDRQRFAPTTTDPAERSQFLSRASELMTALDTETRT